MTVDWSKRALLHLDAIGEYIARDSPEAAERVVRRILEQAASLHTGPLRGRRVPETTRTDVRELIVGKYRLMCQVTPEAVLVLCVIHGARDFSAADLE